MPCFSDPGVQARAGLRVFGVTAEGEVLSSEWALGNCQAAPANLMRKNKP